MELSNGEARRGVGERGRLCRGGQFLPGIYRPLTISASGSAVTGDSGMRISAATGSAAVANAPAAKRVSSGGFVVDTGEAPKQAGGPASLRTVGGIDALMALQGVGDATERRRQAVKRGRTALDILDELKIGVLGGDLSPAILTKLRAAAHALKDSSGEAGLDQVLAEIDLRVEVELAKLGSAAQS
jgi:hypothetical protein